jgi:hypothetical protein
MTGSGLTTEQTRKTTDLSRSQQASSLTDWCIDACGGDSLVALDLAVRTYTAMRRSENPARAGLELCRRS